MQMGSIVEKPAPLGENRIIDAAFRVLEAHGFAGLTIRRIADDLGVKNPALYWHFKNKQQIVDRMAARMLGRMRELPLDAPDWREWLGGAVRWYRKILLSHRDGAEVLSNADLARSASLAEFQQGIAYLASHGFSDRDAMLGMITVFDYALGITYEQQADARLSDRDEGTTLPLAANSREEAREGLFAGGLELILDGLALRQRPSAN